MYILFIITIIISLSLFLAFSKPSKINLNIGDQAPYFELYNYDDKLITLNQYKGKNLVIYFFPKAFTPGWTKQACGFRDQYNIYKENNIEVLGVSYDSKSSQKKFSKKYNLTFPLLSDQDGAVSKLYGVDTYFFPKRVTFLINKDGVVFDIIKNVSLNNYAERIIETFKKNNLINIEKWLKIELIHAENYLRNLLEKQLYLMVGFQRYVI